MAGNETFDLGMGPGKSTDVRSRLSDIANGAPLAGEPPKPRTLDDVSRETGVPWNVIEVVAQDAGIPEEQKTAFATEFAGRMRKEMAKGRDVPAAMKAIFGDDAPIEDALDRAITLAGGAVEGRAAAGQNNDNSTAEDVGRSFAGGALSGVGAIAEGAGTLLDVDDLFGDPGVTDWAQTASKAVGETMRGWGLSVQDGMSDDAKKAVRNSTPNGKLFEPSTWEFDGDVSVEGIAMLTANVLGSLAPVVVAGVFTGGVGGAVVGGMQSAGAGAETAREIVNRATPEDLKANSALYNDMLAAGRTPEEAKAKVLDAAESLAAVFSAPVGGIGGAFTGKLVQKGLAPLAGRGVGTRVGATAGVGAVEEGAQEVAEGVAARTGAELGSGLPVDKMEGTFGEAVLGALGGGVVGGVRGAVPEAEAEGGDDDEVAPEQPVAPAPPPAGSIARAALAAPAPVATPAPTAQPGQMVRVTPGDGQQVDAEYVGEDETGINVKVDGRPVQIARNDIEGGRVTVEPVDALQEAAWGDAEAKPDTSFSPLEDTSEAPETRAQRMTTALDAYLSGQGIEADDAMRAEVVNDINRYGGSVQQAVDDLVEFTRANPAPKADPAAELAEADEAMRPGAKVSTVPGAGALRGPETRRSNNGETNPTTQPEKTAKAPGALPAPAAGDTPDVRWDGMSPDNRAALLGQIGFKNADGTLTAPGRRATARAWADLGERVREKLGERMEQAGEAAPVAPGADPSRGLPQQGRADFVGERPDPQAPEAGRTPRQQPGVNELPTGTDPLAPPAPAGSVAQTGDPETQAGSYPKEGAQNEPTRWQQMSDEDKQAYAARQEEVTSRFDATWKDKKFRAALGDDYFPKDKKARAGVHRESPVAFQVVHGYLDGLDGRDPDPLLTEPGGRGIHPYLTAYRAAITGQERRVTGKDVALTLDELEDFKALKAAGFEPSAQGQWRRSGNVDGTLVQGKGSLGSKGRWVHDETNNPYDIIEDAISGVEASDKARADDNAKREAARPTAAERVAGWEALKDARGLWMDQTMGPKFKIVKVTQDDSGGAHITYRAFDEAKGKLIRGDAGVSVFKRGGNIVAPGVSVGQLETLTFIEDPMKPAEGDAATDPTPAQAEAGNYKMKHVRWNGLEVSIETEKGQTRRKVDEDGKELWSVVMPADYGYIRGTTGNDGDHVDVYMGPDLDSDMVLVVDQVDAETGKFDEHKIVVGTGSPKAATDLYRKGFSDGKADQRIGAITEMTVAEFKAWLADGDHTKPAFQLKDGWSSKRPFRFGKAPADQESVKKPDPTKQGDQGRKPGQDQDPVKKPAGPKIEDFGEKIGGARKDKAAAWTDDLGADIDTGSMTLAQAFPKPDLEALLASGNSMEVVTAVSVIRGAVPRKPSSRRGSRVDSWADDVDAARKLAKGLLDGEMSLADIDKGKGRMSRGGYTLMASIEAYSKLPLDIMEVAAGGYNVVPVHKFGSDDVAYYQFNRYGQYRMLEQEDTIDALVPKITARIEAEQEARKGRGGTSGRKQVKLGVYKRKVEGTHFIGFKVSQVVKLVGGFANAKEARTYLEENEDRLQAQADHIRDGLNERGGINRERKGPAHREGDVTPEMFTEAFGFRGVEFGNWNNQSERQKNLNSAYDAMMDLAGALGLPSRAMSLDGTLGLAFGARGRGGKNPAAAHYEPDRTVMNLTKKSGAGSLAHEWFHALDHYLAKKDADSRPNGRSAARTGETAAVRYEFMSDRAWSTMNQRYNGLSSVLRSGHQWFKRSEEADRARSKPYFATTIELAARGFEKYVIDTLARRGMLNDYLANIDGLSGAYPSTREMRRDQILEAYDTFLAAAIEDIGVQEGVTPQLPEPDDALLFDGPDTGETWDAPEGRYKIIDRDDGTYTIMAPTGATEVYEGPEAVEALMAEAKGAIEDKKNAKDPDVEARRERARDVRERAAKIEADYRRDSGKSTALLSKSYRFPDGVFSRTEKIVLLLEAGWEVKGQGKFRNLVGPQGTSFGNGTWTRQGIAFAEWYALTLDNRRRMEEQAAQDGPTDDEGESDGEGQSISDALAQAIQEEFGDAADTPADPKDPAKRKQPGAAQDARTAGEAGRDAARNAAQGADAAMDGLMKLFGGKNTLNSGFVFSNETYQAAKPLFKQAITKFADAGADVLQMARALVRELKGRGMSAEAITDMMPYLERFIAEEQGVAPDAEAPAQQEPEAVSDEYAPFRETVATHMREGGGYGDIRSLRKQAGEALGRKIEPADHKAIEESAEEAIVGLAREIVQGDGTVEEKYAQLVDLYERQPLLAQKTSTSVENQAYSTPAPLAYIASQLAGITSHTRVTEPSAGTGMLLIEADPALVRANEKNPDRVAALHRNLPGAVITQGDAIKTAYQPYDVLITNPPFGRVKEGGEAVTWPMARTTTSDIDLAIAWRALEGMPEDGSAVLILGGVNPVKYQGDERTKGYQGNGKRQFYSNLYKTYNVVDHFTVSGDLYKRQGAGWPVDVVVIRGKGASARPLPMATAPTMFNSWADLKGKLDDAETLGTTERQPGVGNPDPSENAGTGNDAGIVQGTPDGEAGAADPRPRPGRDDGPQGASVPGSGRSEGSGGRDTGRDRDTGRPGDEAGDGRPGRSGPDGVSGAGTAERDAGSDPRRDVTAPTKRENTEAETDLQVRYAPRSDARFAVGTLVPRNMQDAISNALDAIEAKHGSIDQFVADALGYTVDELLGTDTTRGAFSAEQVDALAMAIDNVDRGKGFIIGDQTGVGKGRIVAAMLRFAERKGLVPVFLTKSPGLYGDMIRDLRDIGEADAHKGVLVTNGDLRGDKAVPLSGKTEDALQSATPKGLKDAIRSMTETGRLPEGYRYLFTTYSQMQTVAGKESDRRPAMRAIAPNAMFVLDESHEAGGSTGDKGWKKKDAAPDRAEFIRELVRAANGTVFSSATYAKSPEVMSLYSTTDIADAVDKPEDLGAAILKGGVPLQQVTAATLTEAGQYARRERSWEGVEMNLDPVPVDMDVAKKATDIIASIFDTDVSILSGARKDAVKNLKKEGFATLPGGRAVDVQSADQTGFSSVLHNVVSQMLLAIKIDQIAERAAAAHAAGEKPVIAVVNTNGALLTNVIEDEGLAPGAPVSMPFDRILHRYVDRLRRITVKDDNNNTHRIDLSDATLGSTAVAALNRLHDRIRRADLSGLTAAPLDKLKDALVEKGMRVGEITGRSNIIENGKLARRDSSEAAKKKQMLAFNSGDLDALIINQSGSTGYSLHAIKGAEGNDGKQRRMIVLQPDPNIDTFMQMLGRIHRTGQTSLPKYEIAVSDLAVEKRVAAVLMRKMASLSANTTASKKSAVSLDVTDFLNEVGDKVVESYLTENWDIASRLQIDPGAEGVAAKLTGRLALMAPDETQKVYDDLERLYSDEIERLNAIGENPLEAQVVDWKAKVLATSVVSKGAGTGSAFDTDTVVETLSVRRLGKPHGWDKVEELADEAKGDLNEALEALRDRLPQAETAMKERLVSLEEAEKAALETKATAPGRYTKAQAAVQRQRELIQQLRADANTFEARLKEFAPGNTVSLNLGDASIPAVVISLDSSAVEGSPLAASKYRVRFAVADAMKEIAMPLSKLGSGDTQVGYETASEAMVQAAFLNGATVTREQRQVVTGNLINAFALFDRGQVVQFTMEDGAQRYGVAMPAMFDAQRHLEKLPVVFKDADQIVAFLSRISDGLVQDRAGKLSIARTAAGYKLTAKKGAREFFSGDTIRDITGEWQARSGPLQVNVNEDQLRAAVSYYQRELGTTFQTEAFLDAARGITGDTLPDVKPTGEAKQKRVPVLPERRGDGQPTGKTMRAIKAALDAELDRLGLTGKVSAAAWRSLSDGPMALEGFYQAGKIGVSASNGDPIATMHHEIIHALRDPDLWGGEKGIFTTAEWRSLVRAARADKAIMRKVLAEYPDQSASVQTEEAVAELYRQWRAGTDAGPVSRILQRIADVLQAIANALRGNGFEAAGQVFAKIASGEIGGRGPDGPGGQPRADDGTFMAKRAALPSPQDAGRVVAQARNMGVGLDQIVTDTVTNAMKDRGGYNLLALVPGRALFKELGRKIPAAQAYLALKERMDTKRSDKHAETDQIAQRWRRLMNQGPKSNEALMKLMHDSTIAGVDPSEPFLSPMEPRDPSIIAGGPAGNRVAYDAAVARQELHAQQKTAHAELRPQYEALPKAFRQLYKDVRDAYRKLGQEQTNAIIGQVERAMAIAETKARRKHAKAVEAAEKRYQGALRRIDADKALTGTERVTARAKAKIERDETIAESKASVDRAAAARARTSSEQVKSLRAKFETNRISGPYFPLSRFGEYFVLARDDEGNVTSFSRHQTVQEQRAEQKDREADGFEVQTGVMSETDTKDMIDPSFVADIQGMLSDVNADEKLLDDIWQRWLATLPDMSLRKHRIHRKNRAGFDADALKAFASHMFHGSHQLARLLYSLDMQEQLDFAQEQAAESDDPVRNGFVVNEMNRRHAFTMNPQGAWWASKGTSLAFTYYLAVSPAAAIVNLSQTTIVGTAVLGRLGGTRKAAVALSKALADFTRSPTLHAEKNTKHLSDQEREAMHEAYRRGIADRTQSHDLASIKDSGVAYNATHVAVMNKISWLFHHSERANREVTFLAAYRLLRDQGTAHAEAITEAGDMTWQVHFDYQNTSKPRLMQSPHMQVLLTFRNFQINFLWRVFRDLHQSVKGESKAIRKEARRQAGAMAAMMLFHAGIKGMYGYGLVMALMGMFFDADDDDPEEKLEKFLFDYLPRPMVKAMLDGVPGTATGINLTSRIGMPNLWFRAPLRPLEGKDLYQHYVNEVLGPIPGIGMNLVVGANRISEGMNLEDGSLIWRGVETALPKAMRDMMKSGRYAYEGALTYNGDPIKDDFSAWEIIAQASGFTPKELTDRYDQNGRLKNKEAAIKGRRSNVIKQIAETIKDGGEVTEKHMRLIDEFNADYPEWPITPSTIRGSVRGRVQSSQRNEGGVQVNPRLDPRLRASLSPLVENG